MAVMASSWSLTLMPAVSWAAWRPFRWGISPLFVSGDLLKLQTIKTVPLARHKWLKFYSHSPASLVGTFCLQQRVVGGERNTSLLVTHLQDVFASLGSFWDLSISMQSGICGVGRGEVSRCWLGLVFSLLVSFPVFFFSLFLYGVVFTLYRLMAVLGCTGVYGLALRAGHAPPLVLGSDGVRMFLHSSPVSYVPTLV